MFLNAQPYKKCWGNTLSLPEDNFCELWWMWARGGRRQGDVKPGGSSRGHCFGSFRCTGFLCASMYLAVSDNVTWEHHTRRIRQLNSHLLAKYLGISGRGGRGVPCSLWKTQAIELYSKHSVMETGSAAQSPSCVDSSHMGSTEDENCCLHRWGPNPLAVPDFVEILIAELQACITRGP